MSDSNRELELEAEDLEKQAKMESIRQNFDLAILLLEDAKDIYLGLGFKGRIGIIDKQILRMNNSLTKQIQSKKEEPMLNEKEFEAKGNEFLQNAKKLTRDKKIDEALKNYEEAYKIYEKLKFNYQCKKIKLDITKLKELQRQYGRVVEKIEPIVKKEGELSLIEKRRMKLREQAESAKKGSLSNRGSKLSAIEEKKRILAEKKEREEALLDTANRFLEEGKILVESKKFKEAKNSYRDAINTFKDLGWHDQVKVLYEELKNIDRYQTQYIKEQREKELKLKEQEKKFQARIDEEMGKKKAQEQERLARLKALPPEMQKKVEKAKMLLEKAEREEKMNKLQMAIKRYQYIIELYNSLPKEKIDLSSDISKIEKKITELEGKIL